MKVRLTRYAEVDTDDAVEWHEKQRPGLGAEFFDAVSEAIAQIGHDPLRFGRLETIRINRNIRRFLVVRFHYIVVFEPEDSEIVVHAVMHTSRSPRQIRTRLNKSE